MTDTKQSIARERKNWREDLPVLVLVTLVAVIVSSIIAFTIIAFTRPSPSSLQCLEAPDVVRGWHTVSAHPETRMVCGWQTAGAMLPVFRCLKMRECLP
jgi:uncharacterized membrane protein